MIEESIEKFLHNRNQAKLQRKNEHIKLYYEGQFHEKDYQRYNQTKCNNDKRR